MFGRITAFGVMAASLALGAPAARADVTFTDSTFAGYTVGFATSPGNATLTTAQCTSCGDPGSALRLTITANDGSNLGAAVMNSLFTYDPQTQGSIVSLTTSVDKNLSVTAPPLFGFGNTYRPVVEQDGKFYTAVLFGPPVTVPVGGSSATSGYNIFTLTDLVATDFNQFDTSTGLVGTAHPNFSGDTITFGIGQVLASSPGTSGSQETLVSDFDNLSIAVKSAALSVPEPSGLALMISGLGLTALVTRRGSRAKALG